jgi:hypothetical protein
VLRRRQRQFVLAFEVMEEAALGDTSRRADVVAQMSSTVVAA